MALDRAWYNTLIDDDGSGLTGSVWDKADVDALMDAIDAEIARLDTVNAAAVLVSNSLALSWGSGVWAKVPFGTEHFDSQNMHAPNDTEIWLLGPAIYSIQARAVWPESAAGWRGMYLSITEGPAMMPPGYDFKQSVTNGLGYGCVTLLNALWFAGSTQRLSVNLYQNSGTPQIIQPSWVSCGVFRIS